MHGRRLLSLLIALILTPVALGQPEDELIRTSVVKIFTTSRLPNLTQPWTRQAPSDSTGS